MNLTKNNISENIFFASNNYHKFKEIELFFLKHGLQIFFPPKPLEISENGKSYEVNALLKAKAYHHLLQAPVISDDSGLEVESLPLELGVETANYGDTLEKKLSNNEKLDKLLQSLLNFKKLEERRAKFISYLCLYKSDLEFYFFKGELKGFISFQKSGVEGFGFDPIFIPENLMPSNWENYDKEIINTFSLAANIEWKLNHSHRAKALKKACQFISRVKAI